MFFKTLIVVGLATLVLGEDILSTPVTECNSASNGGLPLNVYVVGCEDTTCSLPQLQDAILKVVFRADRHISSMTTLATAYLTIGWITVPIPYDLNEAAITCNFLENTYCPILSGEVVEYSLNMYIEPTFPVGTNAALEFRVADQDSQPVFCFRTNIRVVSAE